MALYLSLTNRLETQHLGIQEIIKDISEERTSIRPEPDKWNIHDQITHLAKYQPVFTERINAILQQNEPSFGRYRAEDDPEFEQWRSRPTHELLNRLKTDRKEIVRLLTDLNETELNRIGVHQRFGRLTVVNWTEFFVLHEAHHIFSIFQLANDVALVEQKSHR